MEYNIEKVVGVDGFWKLNGVPQFYRIFSTQIMTLPWIIIPHRQILHHLNLLTKRLIYILCLVPIVRCLNFEIAQSVDCGDELTPVMSFPRPYSGLRTKETRELLVAKRNTIGSGS
jgi:hypothetical protein